jgi:hypothetical protein
MHKAALSLSGKTLQRNNLNDPGFFAWRFLLAQNAARELKKITE